MRSYSFCYKPDEKRKTLRELGLKMLATVMYSHIIGNLNCERHQYYQRIYQTSIVRIIDAVITVLDIEMIFQVETTPRIFHRNWK